MSERDYEDEHTHDIMQSVERYEEMVKTNNALFFDQTTLEELIEYFELENLPAKALEVCNYAIDIYPFSSYFILKKSALLMLHNKYAEASQWLNKLEAIDPSDISIYLLRADIHIQKSEHAKAVEVIHKAFELAGESEKEELCMEMSDVYEHWGKYEKVFEYLSKAIELNPDNDEALNRIWYCVELSHKYEESVEFHQKIIDRSPYSYLAWQNLGYAYFGLGMYEKAIECHEFTLAINETYDIAYQDIAESYFSLRQFRKAIEFYQKAVHYSKPTGELYFCIGECYERLKEYHRARQYYRRAVTVAPDFHYANYRIGVTYKKEKMWEEALQFFNKAIRQSPECIRYIISKAQASVYTENMDSLLDACNRALELNAQARSRRTFEQLISFLIQSDCINEAEVLTDYAMAEKGVHPSFIMLKSICLFRSGCRSQAKEFLEMSLSLDKNKRQLLFRLVPQLMFDKEVAEIVDIYR